MGKISVLPVNAPSDEVLGHILEAKVIGTESVRPGEAVTYFEGTARGGGGQAPAMTLSSARMGNDTMTDLYYDETEDLFVAAGVTCNRNTDTALKLKFVAARLNLDLSFTCGPALESSVSDSYGYAVQRFGAHKLVKLADGANRTPQYACVVPLLSNRNHLFLVRVQVDRNTLDIKTLDEAPIQIQEIYKNNDIFVSTLNDDLDFAVVVPDQATNYLKALIFDSAGTVMVSTTFANRDYFFRGLLRGSNVFLIAPNRRDGTAQNDSLLYTQFTLHKTNGEYRLSSTSIATGALFHKQAYNETDGLIPLGKNHIAAISNHVETVNSGESVSRYYLIVTEFSDGFQHIASCRRPLGESYSNNASGMVAKQATEFGFPALLFQLEPMDSNRISAVPLTICGGTPKLGTPTSGLLRSGNYTLAKWERISILFCKGQVILCSVIEQSPYNLAFAVLDLNLGNAFALDAGAPGDVIRVARGGVAAIDDPNVSDFALGGVCSLKRLSGNLFEVVN